MSCEAGVVNEVRLLSRNLQVFYDGETSSPYGKVASGDGGSAAEPIKGWRKRRLEAAYASGKRGFSVSCM